MTIIYRVQDREGRGPWRPGFSQKWADYTPDKEVLLPSYIEMPGAADKRHHGYHIGIGCISPDQLRRWFTKKEYETLMGYGYRCVTFIGKAFLGESENQCMFESRRPLAEHDGLFSLYGEPVIDVQKIKRYVRLPSMSLETYHAKERDISIP